MAVNVRIVQTFLDHVLEQSKEEGFILSDLVRFYNETMIRKGYYEYKVQPAAFNPLCELYCRMVNSETTMEITGSVKKIGGFGIKSEQYRRLIAIYVNGRGSVPDNQALINELIEPLTKVL